MDYIREMMELGTKIMNTVSDAVDKNDFKGLSDNLKSQVGGFVKDSKYEADLEKAKRIYQAGHQPYISERPGGNMGGQKSGWYGYGQSQGYGKTQGQGYGQSYGQGYGQSYGQGYGQNAKVNPQGQARPNGPYMKPGQFSQGSQTANWQRPESTKATSSSTALAPFYQNKPSTGDSTMKKVFGIGGLALTTPALIATGVSAIATGGVSLIVEAGVMAAGAIGSAILTASGVNDKKLIDAFNKYGRLIGNREYVALDELASQAGETKEEVIKNLEKMVKKGMLAQAKFDEKKTTVMFTESAYNYYKEAEAARVEREKAAAAREEAINSLDTDEAIKETMKIGADYIRKIREYNDAIPDAEMSEKLFKLEQIVDRIFAQVKKEPDRAKDLNKFLNYYLPTTDKLVSAYIDLDKQPQVGENIVNTKKEINEAIDTVNGAFETLLDSLFEEVAWDISSDISVMKTMMAQDGLDKKKDPLRHSDKKEEVVK